MSVSLSDEAIFDGNEEIQVVDEPKEESTAETAQVESEATGEKDEAQPAEIPEESKVSSPDPEIAQVPITSLHGERDRRQAAERELAELRKQVEKEPEKELTSVFDDEKKARQEDRDYIRSEVNSAVNAVTLSLTEQFARTTHGDEKVDRAIDWFKEAAPQSPLLLQSWNDSNNDVSEIVNLHIAHLQAEELKDVDSMKAKMKAEVEAEVRKELEAELKGKQDLRDSIPDSLVDDTSTGGLSSQQWAGAPSDEELFDN